MPAERPPFKLAMIQMLVEGGAIEANLARAEQRIEKAAIAGAQIAVLPEVMNVGWTWPASRELAEPIPTGPSCECLARALRRQADLGRPMYLVAGLVERDGDRVYNAAVLLDPSGQVLLKHRKINELEIGHACYDLGDQLAVARTPFGAIGLMICADGFAPGQVLSRSLALMGADIILSPCAWAVPADYDPVAKPYGQLWRDNYGPVARDFELWIAGVSNLGPLTAGPWAGRHCIGNSLLIGPNGEQVLQGPFGPTADTILYATIQAVPRRAQGDGWAGHKE